LCAILVRAVCFCLPVGRHGPTAGLILLVSIFIFFSVEQSLIASNLAVSRASLAQNNAIRDSNEKLDEAKEELQDEEDECVTPLFIPILVSLSRSQRLLVQLVSLFATGR
jgi:hypothetical protein